MDVGLLASEAQWVAGLRMLRLATGGHSANAEAHRMVAEKVQAFAAAQVAAGLAIASGRSLDVAARQAMIPIRRRVRRNRRRLARVTRKG